jgi:GH24 family phage-related lysozyme (muramidase)
MLTYTASAQMLADMKRWEGSSLIVYTDSRGLPTQGIGRHEGVNFNDPPITADTEALWLTEDLQSAYQGAARLFVSLDQLDGVRRDALVALAFNMGPTTLSMFVPFIGHINYCEWDEASYHLLTNMSGHLTPYLNQVGARAAETALRIATGNILKEYRV